MLITSTDVDPADEEIFNLWYESRASRGARQHRRVLPGEAEEAPPKYFRTYSEEFLHLFNRHFRGAR
jgi:hypothetical protein